MVRGYTRGHRMLGRAHLSIRRTVAAVALLAIVITAVPVWNGYRVMCAGPVDTYPTLAAARDEARSEAPSSTTSSLWAGVLDTVLRVKQSDPVAFPAHVLAGYALEAGGCPATSSADQWRKAAGHAWFDLAARVSADGLARTAGRSLGEQATRAQLDQYARDEPWHAQNLARVQTVYPGASR